MEQFLSLRQKIAFWTYVALLPALLYSKFILTVGMILLILLGLLSDDRDSIRLVNKETLLNRWQTFIRDRSFWIISLFFFIVFLSGIYSEDMTYWAERVRIKLPFLLLPFAIMTLPSFTRRQYQLLYYWFLWVVAFSTLPVALNYAFNYDAINQSIGTGKTIPTPINHIRYSLFIAFALLSGVLLWWQKFYWKYPLERRIIIGIGIYLFLFIHFLSVRSGLVVFYISAGLLSLRFIFYSRRYLLGSTLLIALATLPVVAYFTLPSFQQKIRYTLYDFDQYQQGKIENLSDAERLISMEAGLHLAKEQPLIGHGAGDVKSLVKQFYQVHYPQISNPKLPHNQFISVLAGTGIIGLILFLLAFFHPLFHSSTYQDNFLLLLHVILFFSFFVENTIENAIGVAFYVLFLLIGLNQRKSIRQNHSSFATGEGP